MNRVTTADGLRGLLRVSPQPSADHRIPRYGEVKIQAKKPDLISAPAADLPRALTIPIGNGRSGIFAVRLPVRVRAATSRGRDCYEISVSGARHRAGSGGMTLA